MLKNTYFLSFLLLFSLPTWTQNIRILPQPTTIEKKDGIFRLNSEFSLAVPELASAKLCDKANRFLRRLDGRTNLSILQGVITEKHPQRPAFPSLTITTQRKSILIGDDESYSLEVFPDKITIDAVTEIGAMHALESLLQNIQYDRVGFYFPCFAVKDKARFAWRALMLDPARRFLTVEDIKRTIDGMAACKMNVLHLRLNDDHGWRIESKAYPKLHTLASDGQYYTFDQMKDLVKYSDNQGIIIVPEFHLLTHATAILTAYPELGLQEGPYDLKRKIGTSEAMLNFMNEKVYEFSDKIIAEWTTIFTSKYFHLGGLPQAQKNVYETKIVKEWMKKQALFNENEILNFYYAKALRAFKKTPKKLIVYDDVYNLKAFTESIVEVRHGMSELYKATMSNHTTVFSAPYQLDHLLPAKNYYAHSPLPTVMEIDESEKKFHIDAEHEKFVLGIEAQMWGELVSNQTLDGRLWPNLFAIAERSWSGALVTDAADFYQRVDRLILQYQELSILPFQKMEGLLSVFGQQQDVAALEVLARAVEPYPYFERDLSSAFYKTYTPLTFFADAVMPDPIDARKFYYHVESYSHTMSANDKAELDKILKKWRDNHAQMLILAYENPGLTKLLNLSANLTKLGEIGLDALNRVESKIRAPKSWYDANYNIINGIKDDIAAKTTNAAQFEDGRCRLAILEPLAMLLDMANSDLAVKKWTKPNKSMSPPQNKLRY